VRLSCQIEATTAETKTKNQNEKMKTESFNYIAKNKLTGLYFDGTAFNADQFHPHHITAHPAFFKAVWDYNGNIELIDVLPIKPEYKIRNKRTGEKLVRSNGELGWSRRASGLKWNTRAGAERVAKSLNNYECRGVWEIIELTA
jgi:hypothetical protein